MSTAAKRQSMTFLPLEWGVLTWPAISVVVVAWLLAVTTGVIERLRPGNSPAELPPPLAEPIAPAESDKPLSGDAKPDIPVQEDLTNKTDTAVTEGQKPQPAGRVTPPISKKTAKKSVVNRNGKALSQKAVDRPGSRNAPEQPGAPPAQPSDSAQTQQAPPDTLRDKQKLLLK